MSLSDKELTELLIDTYGFKEAYTQGDIEAVLDSQEWTPDPPVLKEALRDHLQGMRFDADRLNQELAHGIRQDQRGSILNGCLWAVGFVLFWPVALFALMLLSGIFKGLGYK